MRNTIPYRLCLPLLLLVSTAFGATDIAPMDWNMRSDWIDVTDYGAAGDGVTDDTSAIQTALDVVRTSGFNGTISTLYLPAGTYRITNTLTWRGHGMLLIGDGRDTVIQWDGAAGGTMYLSEGATRTRFIGLVWQGSPDGTATHANRAAYGVDHHPTYAYESRMRHENEAFYNFTTAGIRGYGGGGSETAEDPTAEMMVWNCLFKNCASGIIVGSDAFNNYQWVIQGCHFVDGGYGVYCGKGKSIIFDCRFENNSVVDICTNAGLAQRVRRCVSVGSDHFFKVIWGSSGGSQVIEDCHVNAWTNTSYAMNFSIRGPVQVTDCVFTNPPSTSPPIKMSNGYNPSRLTVGGNYCATISTLYSTPVDCNVVELPLGARSSNLPSADVAFLKDTWPADSSHILDVTQPPYNAAVNNSSVDCSAAIQGAIDDAIAADNGSIVYIPKGLYRLESTLSVTGANYSIEGSGWLTRLQWYGTEGENIMELSSPQNVTLREFNLMQTSGNTSTTPVIPADSTSVAIYVSGANTTYLTIDGVYNKLFPLNNIGAAPGSNGLSPGLVLEDLPSSAFVFLPNNEMSLDIRDCGRATILSRFHCGGPIRLEGSSYAKSGFLGIIVSQAGNLKKSDDWDVIVDDNQDIIMSDWYVEQAYNHVKLSRGDGSGSGRVTIGGIKQHCYSKDVLYVDNYEGTLHYTGQSFTGASLPQPVIQVGSNPIDIIFGDCTWGSAQPDFDLGYGGNLIQFNNTYKDASYNYAYPTDVLPSGWEAPVAEGFDHFRELAWYDLVLNHGLGNFLLNSGVELDTVNPSPTANLGYEPSDWGVGGKLQVGSNVRTATVDVDGSPFGPGDKSILFTDTTASATGSRLSLMQYFGPLGLVASDAAVLKFDFRMNSSANDTDVWIRPFADGAAGCALHLLGNGVTASLSGGGLSSISLNQDTWYHVEVVLDAPSVGASSATMTLTEWTVSGPGTPSTYTINSFGSPKASGFAYMLFNQVKGGDQTSVNFDNIQFIIGDPLLL